MRAAISDDREPLGIFVEEHASPVVVQAEERSSNHVGPLHAFEELGRRQDVGRPSGWVSKARTRSRRRRQRARWRAMPGAILEPASVGVERVDPLDGE